MKWLIIIFWFGFTGLTLIAQDKPVKFTVKISPDSILMGNQFEVKFTLENASGRNFEAPDFSRDFNVVSGPNFSSSVNILNGEITQSMTITYYLEPRDPGLYYILPASVEVNGKILETAPTEVIVAPNPKGIRQNPKPDRNSMHFKWDQPFKFDFDFSIPEFPDFREWGFPLFPEQDLPPTEPEKEKKEEPKTRRKITRI